MYGSVLTFCRKTRQRRVSGFIIADPSRKSQARYHWAEEVRTPNPPAAVTNLRRHAGLEIRPHRCASGEGGGDGIVARRQGPCLHRGGEVMTGEVQASSSAASFDMALNLDYCKLCAQECRHDQQDGPQFAHNPRGSDLASAGGCATPSRPALGSRASAWRIADRKRQ